MEHETKEQSIAKHTEARVVVAKDILEIILNLLHCRNIHTSIYILLISLIMFSCQLTGHISLYFIIHSWTLYYKKFKSFVRHLVLLNSTTKDAQLPQLLSIFVLQELL